MILCVAANPSIDRLFGVKGLEVGAIHRPTSFAQVPGGKGLNAARAAHALGGDVEAAALLGGHAGRWIADQVESVGIPLHAAWTHRETRSSLSVHGAPEGLTEFYEHGDPVTAEEWAGFAAVVAEAGPRAQWMTISGSLPEGAPADGYVSLVDLTRVAFDSTAEGIAAGVTVVKLNTDEAARVTGAATSDEAGALAAARQLAERCGGTAVVTRGPRGAVLVAADGTALSGSLNARGPYPVGSGDAFLAGLVVALHGGADWAGALRAALGAGAANADEMGAGVLDREMAERLAGQAVIQTM